MKIAVNVVPNAKQAGVLEESENNFRVKVDAPPKEGKANKRLIEILAQYFDVAKSKIKIVKGEKSRQKIVEIIKS
ncbi:MAG TPA: DUF167 domain-containing protein [Candidatus Subteraquimicrobiales bacterium]